MKRVALILGSVLLAGCYSGGSWYNSDSSYWWHSPAEDYGQDSPASQHHYRGERPPSRPIVVSPGYHLSESSTPVGHTDRDKSWVSSQDPAGYTIEMGRGSRPAEVAKALYQSPKSQRGAQLIYQENGQSKSTGVYGTYKTREEADAALAKLPSDVRGNAKISNWSDVQSVASQSSGSDAKPEGMSRPGNATVGAPQ